MFLSYALSLAQRENGPEPAKLKIQSLYSSLGLLPCLLFFLARHPHSRHHGRRKKAQISPCLLMFLNNLPRRFLLATTFSFVHQTNSSRSARKMDNPQFHTQITDCIFFLIYEKNREKCIFMQWGKIRRDAHCLKNKMDNKICTSIIQNLRTFYNSKKKNGNYCKKVYNTKFSCVQKWYPSLRLTAWIKHWYPSLRWTANFKNLNHKNKNKNCMIMELNLAQY